MIGLTKRQREIIDFIDEFIRKHSYSPSYQDIMARFGFSSLGSVYKHLKVLKRKGMVNSESSCSRSLSLTTPPKIEPQQNSVDVSVIGYLSSDGPIETFPIPQVISLPTFMVQDPEATYVLRVRGDGLAYDHICDGDLVVVAATSEADPGDIVVALINNRNMVVKRYYPEGQHIRLRSSTPDASPLFLQPDKVLIQGIVIAVLRLYV